MRSYSVAVASLAIDAPVKWTDNLLSHHEVADIDSDRRGVARRIPHSTLLRLALVRELQLGLGIGVRDALNLSEALLAAGPEGVHAGGHLRVICDRAGLEDVVSAGVRDALESAPVPRRGRTPKRSTSSSAEDR
jgi:hypothetical protein